MEELTEKTEPKRLQGAPKAFNKTAIREFLEGRGMGGIVDSWALAEGLGSVSQRTIRNMTNLGKLKAMSPEPPFVYTIESIIDFLMENPRYIAQRRETWSVTEETSTLIKKIIYKSWRTMLQFHDEDDLVAEVQYRMLKTPKTACSEGRVIIAILGKIYREAKRQVKTVSLDEINRERTRI